MFEHIQHSPNTFWTIICAGSRIQPAYMHICTWCPSITLEIVFFSFSIEIFIHTKDDIKRVQQIMPKIGQLKGATEVHLLVFEDGNRKKIFQVIVPGGQFGSKNLILMIRIFEIYCSQGMILNSCPPPYFCSPNLQFQGISFSFNHFVMVGHMEVGVFLIENNFVL